jgi:cytochrome c oxidase subunit 3
MSEHEHPAHLAHHFESPQQQFESGKLGIWLFLTTEVLLFSGLFCAYAVYRAGHPEIFAYAHLYLSKALGATNTVVLIFSSFTMAAAVRAAQVGSQRWLVWLLRITLLCACVFLGIKFVEYKAKWEEQLLPGQAYRPKEAPPGAVVPGATSEPSSGATSGPVSGATSGPVSGATGILPVPAVGQIANLPETRQVGNLPHDTGKMPVAPGFVPEKSNIAPAAIGPAGISPDWLTRKTAHPQHAWVGPEPYNVQLFFGIYFAMTGLHGVHVLAGMAAIAWILGRARRGEFGPQYFAPVDFTGLYWHLVDLVWIFLFPLFYLIT